MIRAWVAALLFAVLASSGARDALERIMVTHMLVQIPLLALVGALGASVLPQRIRSRIAEWNRGGVSGALLAVIASSWWMVPRALDWALASTLMEAAKFVTLPLLVGAPLALSWSSLGSIGRGFLLANVLPMWAVVGWAYIAAPVRLCNYYLTDQQVIAGIALVTVSVALGAAIGLLSIVRVGKGRSWNVDMPRASAICTALAIVGAALVTSCAAAPERLPAVDTNGVRAQIDSMWAGFGRAMINADTAALARHYTDRASFGETGFPTARGRAALVAGAAQALASMRYIESRFEPHVTELAGNRAFQLGTYRDVVQPKGQGPLEVRGRVAAMIERDSAGAWRVGHLLVIRDTVKPLPPQSR